MRILVAEDLYLLRDGMVRLIEAYGHEVVATASTGPETLAGLLELRPDVSVIDATRAYEPEATVLSLRGLEIKESQITSLALGLFSVLMVLRLRRMAARA